MSDNERGTNGTLVAFGLGVLAGAITALLVAPASGRETRRRLGQAAQKVGDQAKTGFEATRHLVSDQKERLTRAVEEAREAYRRESSSGAGDVMSGPPPGHL